MSFSDTQIPPPRDWNTFENLCADLFAEIYEDKNTVRYGRQGQRQNGVDILVHKKDGSLLGVQCKEKQNWPPAELTTKEIDEELAKVIKFPHKLSEYIIATTAPSDTNIQDHVEKIRIDNLSQNIHSVYIWDWGKIVQELNKYRHIQIIYYRYFFLSDEDFSKAKNQDKPIIEKLNCLAKQEFASIRQQRWLCEFNGKDIAIAFGNSIVNGDFSYCSPDVKCEILNSLIPIVAFSANKCAQKYLTHLLSLNSDSNITIAKAFILAGQKKLDEAFRLLFAINAEDYLSEAYIIRALTAKNVSLGWLKERNKKFVDLTPDAKVIFLSLAFKDNVIKEFPNITQSDIDEQPVLRFQKALILLASTTAIEYHQDILRGNSSILQRIPLGATVKEQIALSEAYTLFSSFAEITEKMGMHRTSDESQDFALWIKLKQEKFRDDAILELQKSMTNLQVALRRLNMALTFNLPVNIVAIEKLISEKLTCCKEIPFEISSALLAIGLSYKFPKDALNYLLTNYNNIVANINKISVECIIIDFLCLSGKRTEAVQRAEKLQNLDPITQKKLQLALSEQTPEDAASAYLCIYERAPSIDNLENLCAAYAQNTDSVNLSKYAKLFFEQTHSLKSFILWVKALNNLYQYATLHGILLQYTDMLNQSKELQELWIWSLFRHGEFKKANNNLQELMHQFPKDDYTEIQQSIAITTGNFDALHVIVNSCYSNKIKLTIRRLLQIATIAQRIGHQHTKDICHYVVEQNPQNPNILLSAYQLAVSGGWENDSDASDWLLKAIEFSGEKGPVQSIDIEEFVKDSNWTDHSNLVYKKFKAAEIPVYMAAEELNRPWIDLFFLQALANEKLRDSRQRSPIYAFSGARNILQYTQLSKIALDATSLLSLFHLGLLENVISAFSVTIPCSVMSWLFDMISEMQFYQPSQVVAAKKIARLLVQHKLNEFHCNVNLSKELLSVAGYDFAACIAMAESMNQETPNSYFVIHSNPIYKVSSFCQEEVDVSQYSSILRSSVSLVEKLNFDGVLTASEYTTALKYLNQQKISWPVEDIIPDGATIYIDNVSIGYLLHLNLLEKLTELDLYIYISPEQFNSLTIFDDLKISTKEQLIKLHTLLSKYIANESVGIIPLPDIHDVETETILHNPISGILAARTVDAVIVDDRFSNQFPCIEIDHNSQTVIPTLTSYDILCLLRMRGNITRQQELSARTQLRKMGYIFVPVDIDEIQTYLENIRIQDGKIIESAELRAIRENYLLTKASEAIIFDKEKTWLDTVSTVAIETLRNQWSCSKDIIKNEVISFWLLTFLDWRGWCCSSFQQDPAEISKFRFLPLVRLFFVLKASEKANVAAYDNWISTRLIPFLEHQEPLAYHDIIVNLKNAIATHIIEMKSKDKRGLALNFIANSSVKIFVSSIITEFYKDYKFCTQFELQIKTTLSFDGVSFIQGFLFNAIRSIANKTKQIAIIKDTSEIEWKIKWSYDNYGTVVLFSTKNKIILEHQAIFLQNTSERITQCSTLAQIYNINFDRWRDYISASIVKDEVICEFQTELECTPYAYFDKSFVKYDEYVPQSFSYFERLIGPAPNIPNQECYLKDILAIHISDLIKWNRKNGLQIVLMLSITSEITDFIDISSYPDEELLEISDEIINGSSIVTKLALWELLLSCNKAQQNSKFEEILLTLFAKITDRSSDNREYDGFSSLFINIYCRLSDNKILDACPVFYKRLASFTQASLIQFILKEHSSGIPSYAESTSSGEGERYYIYSIGDLDKESIYYPSFISPDILRGVFTNRAYAAALKNIDFVKKSQRICNKLGWDVNDDSTFCFPLGIELFPPNILFIQKERTVIPEAYKEIIQTNFRDGMNISYTAFDQLFILSLVFSFDAECMEWVIASLSNIDVSTSEETICRWVYSLALIAKNNDSPRLLQELFVIIDRLKTQYQGFEISIIHQFCITLIGASVFTDPHRYGDELRSRLMRIAYANISSNDAQKLRFFIEIVCKTHPLLWKYLGRVDAILAMKL